MKEFVEPEIDKEDEGKIKEDEKLEKVQEEEKAEVR